MIDYEQYKKISGKVKTEMLAQLNQGIKESIKMYSANNGGIFDVSDTITCIVPEIATFAVNYVDAIMEAVLEFSE